MNYYTQKILDKYKKDPVPVVYAYRDTEGNIIYIGSTKNLFRRHMQHLRSGYREVKRCNYDCIDYYLYVNKHVDLFVIQEFELRSEAYKLEVELIKELQPVYNRQIYNLLKI